jgi:CheY-like chemotaxis protein
VRNIAVVTEGSPVSADTDRCLKEAGYELLHMPEGRASYDQLCEAPPDAIVLDLSLDYPASGWTIVEQAGLHPDLHALPLIVYCADLQDRARHRSLLDEHDCLVLYRPVEPSTLVTLLQRLGASRALTAAHPGLDEDVAILQRF